MAKSGLFGVVAAIAFAAGIGGANAADQMVAGSSGDSTKLLLDGLTTESKCQILADAMREDNEAVINVGANFIMMSVMDHFAVIRKEFGEKEIKELYRRSFKGCANHPEETISSQARASFQSILQDLSQPGYRNEPELDDVAVPANVQATAAKLQSILPDGTVVSEARITRTRRGTVSPGGQTTLVIKPNEGGMTRVQEIYNPSFVMDREMVGPVQLKSKNNARGLYGPAENQRITITTAFALTASTWAADAPFSFETEMSGGTEPQKTSCKIGQSIDAKTVHTSLAGRAWPLECDSTGSKQSGYYLEELRYFLTMHGESEFGTSDYSIERAEIVR